MAIFLVSCVSAVDTCLALMISGSQQSLRVTWVARSRFQGNEIAPRDGAGIEAAGDEREE
jgi:hypothetical protein